MKKDTKPTLCLVEELFNLEGELTDAACNYGAECSDDNRRALRAAALQYSALAFKLGAK